MKNSQQDIYNAILTIATALDIEKGYTAIINDHIGLPKLTEMIIYQMFVREFHIFLHNKDYSKQYNLILEYCQELQTKGFVNFEK